MTGYWARICILPKTVIAAVDSLCANFLWKGNKEGKGNHLVKWTEVCAEKTEGGLGIKNLEIMNNALVLKQLWGYAGKDLNLWNNWLLAYWTNGRRWWDTGVLNKGSWVLKRMSECIMLSSKCIVVDENALKWIGKGSGFNVKDTYQSLRQTLPTVEWHRLVWSKLNSPRDAIHAWLVAKNRLLTRDRLRKRGVQTSSECVLCERDLETRDHLFFQCRVAKDVLSNVAQVLNCKDMPCQWHLLIPWFNGLRRSRLRTKLLAAGITMAMTQVWRSRNYKLFRNEIVNDSLISKNIIWGLKFKIGMVCNKNMNVIDRRWLQNLGVKC